MPTLTLTHEAPLELIRQYPALAAELVAAMTDVEVPTQPSSSTRCTRLVWRGLART